MYLFLLSLLLPVLWCHSQDVIATPMPRSFPLFSETSTAFGLAFVDDHLESVSVCASRQAPGFVLLQVESPFLSPVPGLAMTVLPPSNGPVTLVENHLIVHVGLFPELLSLSHRSVSVPLVCVCPRARTTWF